MSKFTCIVLCVVALGATKCYAYDDDRAAILGAVKPFIDECSKEHGISEDTLKSAKASHSVEGINPCFLGCVFKKSEVLNSKGELDLDHALAKLKEVIPDEDKLSKIAEVGKKCLSVNDKPVSDGDAGCERASLLTACFLENKDNIPI